MIVGYKDGTANDPPEILCISLDGECNEAVQNLNKMLKRRSERQWKASQSASSMNEGEKEPRTEEERNRMIESAFEDAYGVHNLHVCVQVEMPLVNDALNQIRDMHALQADE